jgi:hypothetical protein
MGNPRDVDARLADLERKQGETSKRQDTLQKELDEQRAAFKQALDQFVDFSDSITYLQKYLMHFALESVEHALMISSATTKFAGFLKLPETSSYINVYLDAAFTAVAAVFPAVRLLKLLDGISKEATVALAVAKAAGSSAPVAAAVVHAPKAGEIADVVKKANDTRMKALAALKSDPAVGAAGDLQKLDSSKAAIRYFVETSTRAAQVFDNVADVVAEQFYMRVNHPDIPQKKTILEITTGMLVKHDFLTPAELDQLEATYIWEMIASYCKSKGKDNNDNVVFVEQTGWGAQEGAQIRGLNSTQLEALIDLFGPQVPRGRYFVKPMVFPGHAGFYLMYIGAKTVVEDTGRMPPR